MGIWASLSALMGGSPRYRVGPSSLGVGVSNLAMEQPGRAVDGDFYSPRYNVRGGINLRAPQIATSMQMLPAYDLRGNGVYLTGDIKLQGLSQGTE
jgi:hypothetical protein